MWGFPKGATAAYYGKVTKGRTPSCEQASGIGFFNMHSEVAQGDYLRFGLVWLCLGG